MRDYKDCKLSSMVAILAIASACFCCSNATTSGFAFYTKRSLLNFFDTLSKNPF